MVSQAVSQALVSGQTALIDSSTYVVSALTGPGIQQVYAATEEGADIDAVNAVSNVLDRVTVSGGSGEGVLTVSVTISSTASVGLPQALAGYFVATSASNPVVTLDELGENIVDPWLPYEPYISPWGMDLVLEHSWEFLSYSNPLPLIGPCGGMDPTSLNFNFSGECVPGPLHDETLGIGEHDFSITLTGEISFTYDEPFYLLGSAGVVVSEFVSFGPFTVSDPSPEGTGPTEISLVSSLTFTLPDGASLFSASGNLYGTAPVPEPSAWLLMLAGLAGVGMTARARA